MSENLQKPNATMFNTKVILIHLCSRQKEKNETQLDGIEWQNNQSQNMPLWCEDCFELRATEKFQKQQKLLTAGDKFSKLPSLPPLQEKTNVNH